MPDEKEIKEKVRKYEQRLRTSPPPSTKGDPAVRLAQRINAAETVSEGNDRRRVRLLLRQASLYAAAERYADVYAIALEVAHLCRLRVHGYTAAYPVVLAPPRRLSELPAPADEPDPEEPP